VFLLAAIPLAHRQPAARLGDRAREIRFVSRETKLAKPRLWSLETPNLHEAQVLVRDAASELDNEAVFFGIGEARFDAETGFRLNGNNLKIKGVCPHEYGHGSLGRLRHQD
jgi:beta-galactosidase